MPKSRTTSGRVSAILSAWIPAGSTAPSEITGASHHACPTCRQAPRLVALRFLDQHYRNAVDDRIAEAVSLADQPPAIFAEVKSLLALRTGKHIEELLRDHGVDPNSATRRLLGRCATRGGAGRLHSPHLHRAWLRG